LSSASPSPERMGDALVIDRPAEGVLRFRLNRPDRLNAIDLPMVTALMESFDEPGARAVVLGSTSSGAFCAGIDLDIDDAERALVSDRLYELYEKMLTLPVPIVVVIDGHTVGAGAQLAIAGDLRVAGPKTKMRVAGPGHGLAVAAWGLPSLVGRGRALDLCLTMRVVEAEEALRTGLVDRVEEDPGAVALDLAAGFAALDPASAGRVKRLVNGANWLLERLREERAGNRAAWTGSIAGLFGWHGEEGR
jgi:enoyl-CoA hydratase